MLLEPAIIRSILAGLRTLDHPCHITAAFGALAHQQQVATLDGAAEIVDLGFVTAVAAPDVGQQPLADVGRDGLPALAGGFGKLGNDSTPTVDSASSGTREIAIALASFIAA